MALERMFLIKFLTETEDAQRGAAALGASLLAIPSAALWAGATLESTMASVDTAISAAGVSTAELSSRFADLGYDASEMLNVSEMAAKMGMQGSESLEKFSETAHKMGVATGTSTASAGSGLSKMGTVMGYSAEEMEKLASSMVALSQTSLVSASSLQNVIVRLGPMAKEAGIGEPVIMAMAAAFEQHGLQAMRALQPMTRFIEMMKKGKTPGIQLARSVGITGEELEKWKLATMEKRTEMFSTALAKMNPDKAAAKLKRLKLSSGMYSAQTLAALKDTKNLTKMMGTASAGMEDNTALNNESAQIQATLTQKLKEMWMALKAVGAQVGLVMIPFVKLFVGVLHGLVSILSLVPKPVLALLGAFSALAGSLLTMIFISRIQFVKAGLEMIVVMAKEVAAIYLVITARKAEAISALSGLKLSQKVTAFRIANRIALLKEAGATGVLGQAQMVLGWLGFKVGAAQVAGAAGTVAGGAAAGGAVAPTLAASGAVTTLWAALGPLALIAFAVTAAIVVMVLMIKKAIGLWKQGTETSKALGLALLILVGPIGLIIAGFLLLKSIIKPIFQEILAPFIEVWKALKSWAKQQQWLMSILSKMAPILKIISIYIIATFFWPIAIIVGLLWVISKLVGWLHRTFGAVKALKIIFLALFGPVIIALLPLIILLKTLYEVIMGIYDALAGPLTSAWQKVTSAFKIFISVVLIPINKVISTIKTLISTIKTLVSVAKTAASSIGSPFQTTREGAKKATVAVGGFAKTMGSSIATGAKKVWGAIFGSSFLHIAEGTAEVLPSLLLLAKLFGVISKAAIPPPIGGAPGAPRAATIGGTIPTAGDVAAGAMGPRAPAVAAAVTAAATRAPSARPAVAKVTVPVTVALDGMVLARALSEYLVELRAERNMNEPGYPLRGVEPAY